MKDPRKYTDEESARAMTRAFMTMLGRWQPFFEHLRNFPLRQYRPKDHKGLYEPRITPVNKADTAARYINVELILPDDVVHQRILFTTEGPVLCSFGQKEMELHFMPKAEVEFFLLRYMHEEMFENLVLEFKREQREAERKMRGILEGLSFLSGASFEKRKAS